MAHGRWAGGGAQAEERRHVEAPGVADLVEPVRMADLRINHRGHVAPRAEGAGLGVHGVEVARACELRHEIGWNESDELTQHGRIASVRLPTLLCKSIVPGDGTDFK